jgi:hypothetical protein
MPAQAQQTDNDKMVWEYVRQLADYLPRCSWQQMLRAHIEICKAHADGWPDWFIAEICKVDRFFLLTQILNQLHCLHPWVYERCREVEADPDDHLDLWARGHFKSTLITFGGSFQEIIRNPEITIGIFANDRPLSKPFLVQIKTECELNFKLPRFFPDIFWEHPRKQAPKWSEDDGIYVQRKGNPREATVSAWGLVDAQPTGRHFDLRIYDDVVTEDSVTTPEMIIKTTDRWELSQNLAKLEVAGGFKSRQWHAGTRYHFADTLGIILKRGGIKARIYPATDDGTYDGRPVLMSQEAWDRKKLNESRNVIASQQLLNPLAGELQELRSEWIQRWEVRPERINVCITVDPANSRKKGSCNTAFIVQGVDMLGNWYFLDGALHKMSLKDRWEMLLYLWQKWSRSPGVQLYFVGYERYGLQADMDYFEIEMQRMPPRQRIAIPVTEVSWVSDGPQAKDDRIRRVIPDFQKRKYFFPYDGELTRQQLKAKDMGKDFLISGPIKRKNELGKLYDVVQYLIDNEYTFFPATTNKDGLDAMSRRFDLPISPPGPVFAERDLIPPHAGEL